VRIATRTSRPRTRGGAPRRDRRIGQAVDKQHQRRRLEEEADVVHTRKSREVDSSSRGRVLEVGRRGDEEDRESSEGKSDEGNDPVDPRVRKKRR
jgi:hypothetical protein